MKKIILFLLFFFLVYYFYITSNHQCKNRNARKYNIASKKYCLLSANNQAQWERGLMFYKKPVDFDGMIFIFPDKEIRSFWNKNTYLDLELFWMDGNNVVGKNILPSILKSKEITTVNSEKRVNKVAEIIF